MKKLISRDKIEEIAIEASDLIEKRLLALNIDLKNEQTFAKESQSDNLYSCILLFLIQYSTEEYDNYN